jgi:hypothetical protein
VHTRSEKNAWRPVNFNMASGRRAPSSLRPDERNAIIFRTTDATAPFVTRNAELHDLFAPQFEEQLRQFKTEDTFVELVRRTIQDRSIGHRPSIDMIAEALHTIQRRLQDAGYSFQSA